MVYMVSENKPHPRVIDVVKGLLETEGGGEGGVQNRAT